MPQYLGNLTLTGVSDTFNTSSGGLQGVLIGNESGFTVIIAMDGTSYSKSLYPGTVDFFEVTSGYSGTIKIATQSNLNNINSWPSSFLQFDAVGINDKVNLSAYPLTLPRLTNVGNSVTTTGGNANAIINDANTPGTSIVEATPGADGVSAVSLSNTGIMQLGSAARKGQLTVAGTSSNITGDGTNNLILESGGLTKAVEVNVNGAQVGFFDRLGLALNSPAGIRGASEDLVLDVDNALKNVIVKNNGSSIAQINASGLELLLGVLNIDATTPVSGTLAGTMTVSFPLWGAGIKVMLVTLAGYNGTVKTITLPSTFARGFIFVGDLGGGTPDLQAMVSGGNVSTTAITAFGSSANGTLVGGVAHMFQGAIHNIVSTIDSFQFTPGGVSNGSIIMIGR